MRPNPPKDARRANMVDHHDMVGASHMTVMAGIARPPAIEVDGDRDRTAHPVHFRAQRRIRGGTFGKIDPDGIALLFRPFRPGLGPGQQARPPKTRKPPPPPPPPPPQSP